MFQCEKDLESACNIIKGLRLYSKKNRLGRGVSVRLFKENSRVVVATLHISYNKKSKEISFSHGLRWSGVDIFPTTNQKLKCTNDHALKMLDRHRKQSAMRYVPKKTLGIKKHPNKITFSDRISHNASLREIFMVRKDGSIYYTCRWD